MQPAKFLEHKIKRQLECNGIEYVFRATVEDKYHQPTDEKLSLIVTGIYHEKNSYISESGSDGSVTSTKPIPMILCLWSEGSKIKVGNKVTINGIDYKVTGVANIQNYCIAGDISLEVIK